MVGLSVVAAGCGGDGAFGLHGGRVRFVLSSGSASGVSGAPSTVTPTPQAGGSGALDTPSLDPERDRDTHDWRSFRAANVTLSSILARDQDGVLRNVTMDLPVSVDVVAMDGGNQVTLPDGDLPPGTYDQIVVVMTQVETVLLDGTQLGITPPGGGWTAIVPVCPFNVDAGATTTVSLQFMVRRAFLWQNSHFSFKPQFQCTSG